LALDVFMFVLVARALLGTTYDLFPPATRRFQTP